MKHHKLLLASLAVALILSLTAIGCSAFTATQWELVDMLVPTAIRFESSSKETLVTLPNDYKISGEQEITVTSAFSSAYVDTISQPNETTIYYGSYADTVFITYSSFHDITSGDFVARRTVTWDFYNQDFDDVIISQNVVMDVIYEYYDTNGILREGEYLTTISPTDDNTFSIDMRSLVEEYGSGNRYIKRIELAVIFEDATCDAVTFTSRESGEYGIVNGERVPTAISGTIDDFDVIGWLVDSVNTFLAMPVFGSGLTIGGLLAIFVAFPVVIWFLKLMAGG